MSDGYLVVYQYQTGSGFGVGNIEVNLDPLASRELLRETRALIAKGIMGGAADRVLILNVMPLGYPVGATS